MKQDRSDEKIVWIDCAKAIGILAVLADHSYGVLYENVSITCFSFFSVSLFILIMGVTTYISETKCTERKMWFMLSRKMGKILLPYFVATIIYSLWIDGMFDLRSIVLRLSYFNASGPFYYVSLYLQLIVANAVLYRILLICSKREGIYQVVLKLLVGIVIVVISVLTTLHSNLFDIYGGGGKLFGGTYLILAYVGMVFAPHLIKKRTSKYLFAVTACTSILWLGVLKYCWDCNSIDDFLRLDENLMFGTGLNPPGVTLMCYAGIVLLWCFAMGSLCAEGNYLTIKIAGFLKGIGESSLYIFLYHRLILDYFLCPYIVIENIWIRRIIYIVCMVYIPIIGNKLYMACKRKAKLLTDFGD
ncbi:MAG: hypothetical protein K2L82_01280 [Lachnospiraceae bacterium]|nr:hypothetical protein [Lachnospiraceae bacterium]